MDGVGSDNFDLDIGKRLVVIFFFLIFLWYFLNYFVAKIKTGQFKLPDFLTKNFPGLAKVNAAGVHQIEIVQRKILNDGSEIFVLDVDERRFLCSKHLQSGIQLLSEIDKR